MHSLKYVSNPNIFKRKITPYFCIFSPHCMACRLLVPQPGIEPLPPAVEMQSSPLHHQVSRSSPNFCGPKRSLCNSLKLTKIRRIGG